MISYRFAHLLLPLQHIRHRMIPRELHVAIEDHTLAQYRCDVRRLVVVDSSSCPEKLFIKSKSITFSPTLLTDARVRPRPGYIYIGQEENNGSGQKSDCGRWFCSCFCPHFCCPCCCSCRFCLVSNRSRVPPPPPSSSWSLSRPLPTTVVLVITALNYIVANQRPLFLG